MTAEALIARANLYRYEALVCTDPWLARVLHRAADRLIARAKEAAEDG